MKLHLISVITIGQSHSEIMLLDSNYKASGYDRALFASVKFQPLIDKTDIHRFISKAARLTA